MCLQIFERETNREKNLEKAVKEAKVKARKEAAKTSESDKDRALDEQDILKVCCAPLLLFAAVLNLQQHKYGLQHHDISSSLLSMQCCL